LPPQSVEAPSGERLRGKRQAWCLLQVKLCEPCLSALKWFLYHARRYTSARILQSPRSVGQRSRSQCNVTYQQ